MIDRKSAFFKIASCFIPLLFYIFAHSFLFSHDISGKRFSVKSYSKWNISPYLLMAIAGEFKGLTADWLAMEAGARMADKTTSIKEKDWNAIIRIFNLSMALDPYFQHTYFLAQGWLPWTAGRIEETNELLQIAKENRTWDWIPAYFMGFNTYYFLGNNAEAGRLFLEGGTIPNSPPFLPILGARFAHKGGVTESAIPLLQSMLERKDQTEPGYQDIKDRFEALKGVYVLEQALKKYEQRYGNKPKVLNELVTSGVLLQLPPNPYNLEYCIDKEGKVYFDKPNC